VLAIDYGSGLQLRLDQDYPAFFLSDPLQQFHESVVGIVKSAGVAPMSLDEVVEAYRGPRRARYEAAKNSLGVKPICKRDARISMFVKFEKNEPKKGVAPVARIISPPSYRYIAKLATYLKPISKRLLQAINKTFGYRVVAKGLDTTQRAQLLESHMTEFPDPVVIPLDLKKLDAHLQQPALLWEFSFYRNIYADQPRHQRDELNRLLSWQIDPPSVAHCTDGKVRMQNVARRTSGQINTGDGNIIIVTSILWEYIRGLEDAGVKVRLVNDGDDNLLIADRANYAHITRGVHEHFRKFGLYAVVEPPVDVLEEVEFCRSHPVWNGESFTMVRNFPQCMTKDTITAKPMLCPKDFDRARAAFGGCSLALHAGIPIMQSHALWLMRGVENKAVDWRAEEAGGWHSAPRGVKVARPVTEEARVSFWKAFGVAPWTQIEYERAYDSDAGPQYRNKVDGQWMSADPFRYGVCSIKSTKINGLEEPAMPRAVTTMRLDRL
jgi:hypothetical protein